MLKIREFKPGDTICAATDLPLHHPHPDFGTRIPRDTPGRFVQYRQRRDRGTLVCVLFRNPRWSASSLLYVALPVQIKKS